MFKTKIYAGIAIIVILGMLAMFHIYRNLGNVAGYLATLDSVSVPFSIAALEMEKNVGEYANGVLRYIRDPQPALRKEAVHDIEDFGEQYAIYMRLSTNHRERALGKKVNAQFKELLAAGNALMDKRDHLDKVFGQTTAALEHIDALLDGPMLAAAPDVQPARNTVLAQLENVEAETAEVGFWLTLFKNRPTSLARKRLLQKVAEQHDAVKQYLDLPHGAKARELGARMHELHVQVAANVGQVLSGETQIDARALKVDALASHIDGIFDNQIQVMLMEDLAAPQENANVAIEHVQDTLLYIIPVYFLVAVIVGVLLIVAIIRPLRRLATGTEAIGAGNLDHRIPEQGNDEFGKLARQFNLMAERLRQSTVSRGLLETSEKQLQHTVAELREEIVERQQAERERERLRTRLQRNETLAAMGQLVAGVAHEVRNPLFGISSTLDAMDASAEVGPVDPRYREVLRREASRLNKLMAELLEYGRAPPESHAAEPLGRTLAEAIRNCQATSRAAGVGVVNEASDDALVEMNHDRLLQVHVNLIENALQHAPQGSQVILATRAFADEAGQRWIEYSVTDAGPGFAAEDLPRVFDPFFTRRRKGTGLGLAIVRRIVDEHHGSIEPSNHPQGGAVMTVRLPVAQPGSAG
ncbi:MAG TPA: ATP-binding protein [Oleiagrimonas sp.]|nr:ATP-binding protein [Oleiagrimonas sp.]